MNSTRLYVGNLPFQATEDEILLHFSQAGSITSLQLVADRPSGRSRGFGFVDYATLNEATRAVAMFHQQDFQGRSLTVQFARPGEEPST